MTDDDFTSGPTAPPYFGPGAPSVFCDDDDEPNYPDAYIPLCSCGSDESPEMLPILRGIAWSMCTPWERPSRYSAWFDDAAEILGVSVEVVMLLSKLLDALHLTEHGSTHRWPWLTAAGWRALWAYEMREDARPVVEPVPPPVPTVFDEAVTRAAIAWASGPSR